MDMEEETGGLFWKTKARHRYPGNIQSKLFNSSNDYIERKSSS